MEDQELYKSIREIGDSNNKTLKQHENQINEVIEEVRRLKDNSGGSGSTRKPLVDATEIKAFVEKTFDSEGRKTSNHASFKINLFPAVNKAAEIMGENFYAGGPDTVADVFTGRVIDPRLYEPSRKRNLILDHIPITPVSAPTLYYMEKKLISGDSGSSSDTGAADFITVAGAKPGRSFRVTTGKAEAKKAAILATVADKLLRDIPSFENWIRNDLVPEVLHEYNDKLLNADGTGNDPLGLLENAIGFSVSTAFANAIPNPNLIDTLVAACASMRALKEQPGRILISDDNFYKLFVLKDQQSRYQNANLVYTNARGQVYVAGVPVFGVDDDDIDSDHFLLLGADLGFKVNNYNSLVFERGLNGEDFKYDRTSFRCFQEVLSYIPTHRYNSVMYDTLQNVESAIDSGS